jgi:hypothetical protein
VFRKLVARGWRQRDLRPRLTKREGLSTVLSSYRR